MGRQPNFGTPIAFGLILAALVLGYFNYSSSSSGVSAERKLRVEGNASEHVEAEKAVWTARTINESSSLSRAYQMVQKDRDVLTSFIQDQGFDSTRLAFEAMELQRDPSGPGTRYTVVQGFRLEGDEVGLIRTCAREAGSLMSRGLSVQTEGLRYHYEAASGERNALLQKAISDARSKAEAIADTGDVSISGVHSAQEGRMTLVGKDPGQGIGPERMVMSSPKGRLSTQIEVTFNIE